MTNQQAKADRFFELHERAFIIPNPWDVGSARILAHLGFAALATTGAGCAFAAGRPDGKMQPEEMLAYYASIAGATELPVSADMEEGFGDDPAAVHDFVVAAARTGIVGGSIEDRSYGRGALPFGKRFELSHAVDRIRAAVEAASTAPFRFLLTARCENFLVGHDDLTDTITRLQAYQDAGADCLYAPGLSTREQIRAVTSSVDRPVTVVMGLVGEPIPWAELAELGVRRVSLGSTLARAAFGSFIAAATELRDHGTFGFASSAIPYADLGPMFAG